MLKLFNSVQDPFHFSYRSRSRSGSADPYRYHWITDPDLDSTLFFSGLPKKSERVFKRQQIITSYNFIKILQESRFFLISLLVNERIRIRTKNNGSDGKAQPLRIMLLLQICELRSFVEISCLVISASWSWEKLGQYFTVVPYGTKQSLHRNMQSSCRIS